MVQKTSTFMTILDYFKLANRFWILLVLQLDLNCLQNVYCLKSKNNDKI